MHCLPPQPTPFTVIYAQLPVYAQLCVNVMSSAKLEANNILHYRQIEIKQQPQVTCTENVVKYGNTVFEICERTNIQTDIQTC